MPATVLKEIISGARGTPVTVPCLPRGDPSAPCGPAGLTALHIAAMWGRHQIADILLAREADTRRADEKGETPSDIAERLPPWLEGRDECLDPELGLPVRADDIRQVRDAFRAYDSSPAEPSSPE